MSFTINLVIMALLLICAPPIGLIYAWIYFLSTEPGPLLPTTTQPRDRRYDDEDY